MVSCCYWLDQSEDSMISPAFRRVSVVLGLFTYVPEFGHLPESLFFPRLSAIGLVLPFSCHDFPLHVSLPFCPAETEKKIFLSH